MAPVIITAKPGFQHGAQVAATSSGFLVTWRHNMSDGYDFKQYGARVSSVGALLDPGGLVFCDEDCGFCIPAVASSGNEYFLVRESNYPPTDIRATRLSAQGEVLGPPSIPVSTAAMKQSNPAVAYGGGVFMVVWGDQRNSQPLQNLSSLYAARIGP